jgi:hypothetical protein
MLRDGKDERGHITRAGGPDSRGCGTERATRREHIVDQQHPARHRCQCGGKRALDVEPPLVSAEPHLLGGPARPAHGLWEKRQIEVACRVPGEQPSLIVSTFPPPLTVERHVDDGISSRLTRCTRHESPHESRNGVSVLVLQRMYCLSRHIAERGYRDYAIEG